VIYKRKTTISRGISPTQNLTSSRIKQNQGSKDLEMTETHQLRGSHTKLSVEFRELNAEAEKLAKTCRCATVPSLDHLTLSDYDHVYCPSEDSYLLLGDDLIGFLSQNTTYLLYT